jgi:hypothetical protein
MTIDLREGSGLLSLAAVHCKCTFADHIMQIYPSNRPEPLKNGEFCLLEAFSSWSGRSCFESSLLVLVHVTQIPVRPWKISTTSSLQQYPRAAHYLWQYHQARKLPSTRRSIVLASSMAYQSNSLVLLVQDSYCVPESISYPRLRLFLFFAER